MHIIFDLDGTLTDSGPGIIRCARQTFAHYGIPIPDDSAMRTMVGPPLRSSFARFGIPEHLLEEAIRHYRRLYTQDGGMFENAPYPGIIQLLELLHNAGHQLFVATSKPEHMAVAILEHFHMAPYFDHICGALQDGIRDSKSAVIAHLLQLIEAPNNPIMVGDTVFDVFGAAEHGIPTAAVTWGYGDPQAMAQAGAAAVLDSPDALYRFLSI